MPSARIKYLIERYFDNTCTAAERLELAGWISHEADEDALNEALGAAWEEHIPLIGMPDDMSGRIVASLFTAAAVTKETPVRRLKPYTWWAAAGIVLLGVGGWWLTQYKTTKPVIAEGIKQRYKNEVAPGGNRAMLTLSDGSVIALDSAANGVLTQQGNVKIVKEANGELFYDVQGGRKGEVMYNIMSTPRGGQYHLKLPDGTLVWLNAASSITYPVSFTGREREVSVTGEAYFEVAANVNMPFKVKAGAMNITVMGTRFNVNAYTEDPVPRTTLVEGAIGITSGESTVVLKPGQQAQARGQSLAVINNIDTDEIIAWKNGFFQFTDADMPTVMRQIEKWYNVNVIYEGAIPKRSFGGGMQRSLPLSEVLAILEENDVKFKIEGKNIMVLK